MVAMRMLEVCQPEALKLATLPNTYLDLSRVLVVLKLLDELPNLTFGWIGWISKKSHRSSIAVQLLIDASELLIDKFSEHANTSATRSSDVPQVL